MKSRQTIAKRHDSEGDMGRVLPVMADRRVGIVHRGWPMHERGRSQGGFAADIQRRVGREIVPEFLRIAHRKLIEKIVRMLPVVQRLSIPGFTAFETEADNRGRLR